MDTRAEALRDRVARLEVLMGGPNDREDAHTIFDRLQSLAEGMRDLSARVGAQPGSSHANVTAEILDSLREAFESLQTDVEILKRGFLAQPQQGGADRVAEGNNSVPGRLKVPEPRKFEGNRSAKDLENFIWDMQEYFTAAKVPEEQQVSIASMFMMGDAKLWYRTRAEEDENAGRPKIETWEILKRELRDQFLPTNTTWVARDAYICKEDTSIIRS